MALSFEEIIERANKNQPLSQAHVFIEYADNKRGYFKSFYHVDAALRFCNSHEGRQLAAQAYGKNGEDID